MNTDNRKKAGDSDYLVPGLKRGLQVIELLAENHDGMTLSEIVAELKYPKNSIFRITETLLDAGYLFRDEVSKNFFISRKLLLIGILAVTEHSLIEKSFDLMCQLRDSIKETVLIGTIAQNEFVVMEQAAGVYPFKFMLDIGARLPLHASAPAKAIIAYLPEIERDGLLDRIEYKVYSSRTIRNNEEYRKAIEEIRITGYAIDRGEQLDGVHCIAAPVFDRRKYPIAAIWTTGPGERLSESEFESFGKRIKEYADMISQRLI